jgi:hypothetical protein
MTKIGKGRILGPERVLERDERGLESVSERR